jgi:hypothetical protein
VVVQLSSSAGKNHPAIERGRATFAAAAGLDSQRVSGALNNVTETEVFIANESRYPHTVRLAFTLDALGLRSFSRHLSYLPE